MGEAPSAPVPVGWFLRRLAFGVTVTFLILFARDMYDVIQWPRDQLAQAVGGDYRTFMDAGQRVLAGGPYYSPDQFQPYPIRGGDILYPPLTLDLIAPVSMLPEPFRAMVWWAVPLGFIVWVVARHRPAWWAWPLLAICTWWWRTPSQIIHGNLVMWIGAAVALGTVYRWPSALVLVKMSVLPFGLIGIRARSWWLALAAMLVLSIPFASWTLQYPAVVANLQGSFAYSLPEYPFLAISLIAYLGRTVGREPQATST